jgi:hypothetical protein
MNTEQIRNQLLFIVSKNLMATANLIKEAYRYAVSNNKVLNEIGVVTEFLAWTGLWMNLLMPENSLGLRNPFRVRHDVFSLT